jgi:hypothetical protein
MNKTHFFKWIFLFLIGCCACNSFTKNKPSDLRPMDSVAVMIAECFLIEGEVHVHQWTYDASSYSFAKYDAFFAKHKITPEAFTQNIRYYLTDNKYADKVMDKVSEIVDQHAATMRDSLNIE